MIVNVKQEHIDDGEREDIERCPIALALREQTGDCWTVGPQGCEIEDADIFLRLPLIAQQFVKDFDTGNSVTPFSFELKDD